MTITQTIYCLLFQPFLYLHIADEKPHLRHSSLYLPEYNCKYWSNNLFQRWRLLQTSHVITLISSQFGLINDNSRKWHKILNPQRTLTNSGFFNVTNFNDILYFNICYRWLEFFWNILTSCNLQYKDLRFWMGVILVCFSPWSKECPRLCVNTQTNGKYERALLLISE